MTIATAVRSGRSHLLFPFRPGSLVLLFGLLLGLSLAFFGRGSVALALLAIGGLVGVLVLIGCGPLWCLGAFTFMAVLGWSPTILGIGVIDLTPLDVLYAALLIAVAIDFLGRSSTGQTTTSGVDIGQRALWLFVVLLGLGILGIYRRNPAEAGDSLVSWIRLVQTATLISLIPAVVKTRDHVASMMRVVALGGFVSLVLALNGLTAARDAVSGAERAGTFVSSNSVGLLAAVLLVLVLHSPVPSVRWQRVALGAVAIAALISSKSIGSLIAFAVVLTIGGFHSRRPLGPVREHTLLMLILRVLCVSVVVIDLALVLRPESLPGRLEFASSSTMHRVLVGVAGLEMFQQHPLLGVGWQQSSNPEFIGDATINRALRHRFPNANPRLFPDVSATSVHNFYIQTLAEAGIVGIVLLLWALMIAFGRIRSLVRRLKGDEWAYQQARSLALALLVIVVWLNENPLFGGQLAANLIVVLFGLLGALARITWRPVTLAADRFANSSAPASRGVVVV